MPRAHQGCEGPRGAFQDGAALCPRGRAVAVAATAHHAPSIVLAVSRLDQPRTWLDMPDSRRQHRFGHRGGSDQQHARQHYQLRFTDRQPGAQALHLRPSRCSRQTRAGDSTGVHRLADHVRSTAAGSSSCGSNACADQGAPRAPTPSCTSQTAGYGRHHTARGPRRRENITSVAGRRSPARKSSPHREARRCG